MEQASVGGRQRAAEQGYALLSLLAALTITLAILASAVPSVKHEMQREKEEEMFWRARQVAINLGAYKAVYGEYPLKLEDLTKPPELATTLPGGKFKLRSFALIDPMTNEEWVPLRRGDPRVTRFLRGYLAQVTQEQRYGWAQAVEAVRGLDPRAVLPPNETQAQAEAQQAPDADDKSKIPEEGPIIGIVSRSKKPLIRTYFGAKTYDQSLILTALCVAYNPQDRPVTVKGACALKLLRMPTADQYLDLPAGELPPNASQMPAQLPSPPSAPTARPK